MLIQILIYPLYFFTFWLFYIRFIKILTANKCVPFEVYGSHWRKCIGQILFYFQQLTLILNICSILITEDAMEIEKKSCSCLNVKFGCLSCSCTSISNILFIITFYLFIYNQQIISRFFKHFFVSNLILSL